MARLTIRPSTSADVAAWFDQPLAYRARCWTALKGGRIIGIGGVAVQHNQFVAFLKVSDEGRRHAVTLHKMGRRTLAFARDELGARKVFAEADPTIPAAERWLARLGFARTHHERVWVWVQQQA